MKDKKTLLRDLEELLPAFQPTVCVTADTQPGDVHFKHSPPKSGMAVFLDAVSEASLIEARLHLAQTVAWMWKELFTQQEYEALMSGDLNVVNRKRNKKGGFGNLSFGYFFKQFPDKYIEMEVQGVKLAFDINAMYSRVILPLLLHKDNRHTAAVLLGLGNENGMVSPDSVKWSVDYTPVVPGMTKPVLTAPHMDIYGPLLQRIQAIINVDTGRTKLFYVPGTGNPMVKKLISEILVQPGLYERQGYIGIKDKELLDVLIKFAVAAPARAMVAWESGVIHFEGKASKRVDGRGLYTCKSITVSTKNSERLRFVVGTHQPVNLSEEALIQLGLGAEGGIEPAAYRCKQNQGTDVDLNMVFKKSTQNLQARVMYPEERERGEAAARDALNASLSNFVKRVTDPLKRHLYGVSQDFDTLGFSARDAACLKRLSQLQR